MTATRPRPAPIVGRFVRLEPLRREHLPALFAAIGHPIIFAGGFGGGPAAYRDTVDGFIEWAETYFDWEKGNPFAVFVVGGPHDGELVGTTTLTDFDLAREATHIGWTAYDPRVWGTAVNAEAKLLLLGTAFDSGFGRVLIQADALNERSRAAIAGIGATFEGVLRRDRLRADGTWRDSALYSVIVDDWPRVKALLEQRLAGYGDRPVLFRSRTRRLRRPASALPQPGDSVGRGLAVVSAEWTRSVLDSGRPSSSPSLWRWGSSGARASSS